MYSTILVPLDGSALAETVLPYVQLFGKAFDSEIHLLRTFELLAGDYEYSAFIEQITDDLRNGAEEYLTTVASKLREQKLRVTTTIEQGQPAKHILAHSTDANTLTVISTHGRSGILRLALGSVVTKVIMAATGPVLIVRPRNGGQVRLTEGLVPLDGSQTAEEAVPHAIAVSQALALKIRLVHVVPSQEHGVPSTGKYHDVVKDAEIKALAYLNDLASRIGSKGVSSVRTQLVTGDPAKALLGLVLRSSGSLIAMTTHGRSGLQRWILGSVADCMVRQSNRPVLLVRAKPATQ